MDSSTSIKDLINKLLAGKLNSDEKKLLKNYIGSVYKDKQLDDLMREHWINLDKSKLQEEPSLQNVQEKLWSIIHEEETEQKQAEKKLNLNWKSYVVRIAAILFLPLLVYTGIISNQFNKQTSEPAEQQVMQQVVANPGSRVHFTLPDETEVWLNSESKLEYNVEMNNKKQREVKLTGQGYFKVAHNKNSPFLVEANEIKIKVLGTSFDVSNYRDDGQIISTLEEGSIAILNSKGKEVAKLVPGQQATLNKSSKELFIENVETELTTSWKDGRLIFNNSSLEEVIDLLERWFNCTIKADDSLLNSDLRYTATIQDETLGEVLQMIEISTAVKTNIKNREVYISAK